MKNKILLEIYFPQIDEKYNIYVPLNKNVANIIELICKAINETSRIKNIDFNNLQLYSTINALPYSPNTIIKESNIRNGMKLILM